MTTYDINHVIHHVTYDIHVTKGCITMGCNDDQSTCIETANFNNFWANFIKMNIIFFECCGDKNRSKKIGFLVCTTFIPYLEQLFFRWNTLRFNRDEHQRNSRRETLRRSDKANRAPLCDFQ